MKVQNNVNKNLMAVIKAVRNSKTSGLLEMLDSECR